MSEQASQVAAFVSKITASADFPGGEQVSSLLHYLVAASLSGEANRIKAYSIGVDVLGRAPDFDPNVDAIVRVQVGRLRKALKLYYATDGKNDAIRFDIPVGSYRCRIERVAPPAADSNTGPAQRSSHDRYREAITTVRILPFRAISDDPVLMAMAETFPGQMSQALSSTPLISVIAPSDTTGSGGFHEAAQGFDTARQDGATQAQYLITGTVYRQGNRVRIAVQLIDAAAGHRQVWSRMLDRSVVEMEAAQDVLATEVQYELRTRMITNVVRSRGKPHDAEDAGKYLYIQSSPLPSLGLKSLEAELSIISVARTLLFQAPNDPMPCVILADKLAYLGNAHPCHDSIENWREADVMARRAFDLAPSNSDVNFLIGVYFMHSGKHLEAEAAFRCAADEDPFNRLAEFHVTALPINHDRSASENPHRIMKFATDMQPSNPLFWAAHSWLSQAYLTTGHYEAALSAALQTHQSFISPITRYRLCAVLVQLGRVEEAQKAFDDSRVEWPGLDPTHYATVSIPRMHGDGPVGREMSRVFGEMATALRRPIGKKNLFIV